MKKKVTKILLFSMILILTIACLTACGGDGKSYNVTVMDGETVIGTFPVADGSKLDMDIVKAKLQKEGAEFGGLYTDKELTQTFVAENEITSDLTLYARFTTKSLYIIVNSDGGSAVEKVKVSNGQAYNVPIPTKEGYTFTKFTRYDYDAEEDVDFPASGTYSMTTDARIKANWTINEYTVTFYDGETKVTDQKVEHGKMATLPAQVKAGYTFNGWFEEDADEAFKPNTAITKNVDLYASFTGNTYHITFNKNGGNDIADLEVTFGEAFTLPMPTRTGYHFTGYTLNGEAYVQPEKYATAGDLRLVANWEIDTFTVTMKDENDETLSTQENVAYGSFATAWEGIAGYTIEGYYLAVDDGVFSEKVTLGEYTIVSDTVLYVKTVANTYRITVINYSAANCEVTFGQAYELPTKEALEAAKAGEWLSFDGYTLDGEAFERTGTYTWAKDITVTATYTKDPMYQKSTVTLLDGTRHIDDTIVDDGANIAAYLVGINTTKTGYTFNGWLKEDESAFDMTTETVNDDLVLYASYTANQYTIYIDENGGDAVADITVTYDAAFVLPAEINKRGYTFTGFAYNNAAFVAGTYTIADNITIVAQFTQNKVNVTFITTTSSTTEYNQYVVFNTIKPADPTKDGYTFLYWSKTANGAQCNYSEEIAADTDYYAVFEANTYSINIIYSEDDTLETPVTYDDNYTIAAAPTRFGYTFVKYVYTASGADYTAALSGTYALLGDLNLTIVWEDNTFIKNSEKKYFQEVEESNEYYTYVFLTGESYQFSGYSIGDAANISITAIDTFTAATVGAFDLTLTPNEGAATVLHSKIVYSVDTMGMGADYQAMIGTVNDATLFQTTTTAANYVMNVGVNNFVPDVTITNDSHATITIDQANIVLSLKEGSTDLDEDLAGRTGNTFNFDSELVGKTVTVTMQSKYDVKAMPTTISMKLALNDGVNVYNNDQMRAQYANLSVHKINVLRNIEAKLAAGDYIAGHGESYQDVTLTTGGVDATINMNVGAPINDFNHSVYVRKTRTTANSLVDNVVVNGNYFEIDGSKLPYVDNRYDRYGSGGSELTSGDSYRLSNTQVGLFLYRCANDDWDGGLLQKYADGQATFNNLRLNGNNIYSPIAEQDLGDGGLPLLKMSSAYIGVVVRGGTVYMNNVSLKDWEMGMMLHGSVSGYDDPGRSVAYGGVQGQVQENETQSVKLYMDSCMIDNSWANSLYLFDLCTATLTNTKIGRSSGAAIHADDRPRDSGTNTNVCSLGYSNLDIELTMDIYTANNINNWVAGDEAWFVAYGQATTAVGVKTLIEGTNENPGVKQMTKGAMTIIDKRSGEEKMNFAILVNEAGNGWSSQEKAVDNNGGAKLSVKVLAGDFSFFYNSTAEAQAIGAEAANFMDDVTEYGTALATSDYPTAMAAYARLMAAGRPYVIGGAGGRTVMIPVYYAHEVLQQQ